MDNFEILLDQAAHDEARVDENFELGVNDGLYIDGNIALSRNLRSTPAKACVLAEELGHHHTTVGDILDMSDAYNRKQERQARLWGYNKIIGLRKIIDAFEIGCKNRYEIAEYLGVTEAFFQNCIDCYRDKYGIGKMVDNYYIRFIPNLIVGKIL